MAQNRDEVVMMDPDVTPAIATKVIGTSDMQIEEAKRPDFKPLNIKESNGGKIQTRKVRIPSNRLTPLKNNWMKIYTPIVEHLKLQIRMLPRQKVVELRTCTETEDTSSIQRAADFVRAFSIGFDIDDAAALLRLDELYLESFEIKDVKTLQGDHLARAIGRIAGKDGKTKFTIENTSKTRIVLADTRIHILGSFKNIKIARDAISNLILGSPPGKVYANLRTIASRLKELKYITTPSGITFTLYSTGMLLARINFNLSASFASKCFQKQITAKTREFSTKKITQFFKPSSEKTSTHPILLLSKQKFFQTKFREYSNWEKYGKVDYGVRGSWSDGSKGHRGYRKPFFSFDLSPKSVIYGIIGINCGVFLLWKYAEKRARFFNDLRLNQFMCDNFLFSVEKIKQNKFWVAITSEFSHISGLHLLANSVALYSIGTQTAQFLGAKKFLAFYLMACLSSSVFSYAYKAYLSPILFNNKRNFDHDLSLGSSGATNATVVLFASLFPRSTFLVFFIPCPAWLAAIGFIGFDIYNSLFAKIEWLGSSAHIGGAAFGFSYYWFYLKQYVRKF
ncbi:hypothetical protein BB561_000071 [Smittium simulii]|uniref:Pre-rRNA-processing protein PNO1 n=1 Tax=Smittium simulii TaxID=133385 RepID=A0A2T9Z0Q4_9FUNG|nr:hypothetical protein BB561_000071 [Smittium simulii]